MYTTKVSLFSFDKRRGESNSRNTNVRLAYKPLYEQKQYPYIAN